MTHIQKLPDGLQIGNLSVGTPELEMIVDRQTAAYYSGSPDDLLDQFEASQAGTPDYKTFPAWLADRAEPGWDLIHAYTRKQALEDGTLHDLSALAKEAGFRIHAACTAAVHAQYIAVPPGVTCQDESGRAWDIVYMMKVAVGRDKLDADTLEFQVYVRNDNRSPKPVWLKAAVGPGDAGEPVLTIMCRHED